MTQDFVSDQGCAKCSTENPPRGIASKLKAAVCREDLHDEKRITEPLSREKRNAPENFDVDHRLIANCRVVEFLDLFQRSSSIPQFHGATSSTVAGGCPFLELQIFSRGSKYANSKRYHPITSCALERGRTEQSPPEVSCRARTERVKLVLKDSMESLFQESASGITIARDPMLT